MAAKSKQRVKTKETTKKIKKKISVLVQEHVDYVDYKDVSLLQRFMSDRSKIRARRVNGNDSQQQRDLALAVKNAREMALLPYAKRVTTQRTGGGGGGRDRRGEEERDLEVEVDEVEVGDVGELAAPDDEEGDDAARTS